MGERERERERENTKCEGLNMEEDLKVRGSNREKGSIGWGLIKVC